MPDYTARPSEDDLAIFDARQRVEYAYSQYAKAVADHADATARIAAMGRFGYKPSAVLTAKAQSALDEEARWEAVAAEALDDLTLVARTAGARTAGAAS